MKEEATRYFDLSQEVGIRAKLLQLGEDEYILIITLHHIISDGWSIEILLQELSTIYTALVNNHQIELPTIEIDYGDFTLWLEEERKQTDKQNEVLQYWQQQLKDVPSLLKLQNARLRPRRQTFNGSVQHFTIDTQLTTKINLLSQDTRTSVFMVLIAAFFILMHRYSNQDSIVIGTPIAKRFDSNLEKMIGCLIDVIPLRSDIEDNPTFADFLTKVKQVCLDTYQYADFPLEKLLSKQTKQLGNFSQSQGRDMSYSPWFQVVFNVLNMPQTNLQLPNLEISDLSQQINKGSANFDMMVSVTEKKGRLQGTIEYNTDIYDDDVITRLIRHWQTLLFNITNDTQKKVKNYSILTPAESNQLLNQINQTTDNYSLKKDTVPELFAQQVIQTPDNIAVVFEGRKLTYSQLNQQANQLAHHLQELGVQDGVLVGVYLDRSTLLIITLLAILKARGAYLPLDINYPAQRLAYIIDNAQVSIIISESETSLSSILPPDNDRIRIINPNDDNLKSKSVENLPSSSAKMDNLAYVIYTSGSTGKPKGVEIEHHNLTNLLTAFKQKLQITKEDRWLSVTTISFDIAALEIFLPLITGATLHLVSQETARDGISLLNQIKESSPTFLQATPTTWQILLSAGWKGSPQLTALIGGEALSVNLAEQLLPKVLSLYNVYGPTETTIWSLTNHITTAESPITIGKPIANTQVYILDKQMQPLPIGIIGELYIGGDGVARGYRRLPQLTAEKFILNPFIQTESVKTTNVSPLLYKTGDNARYLANGEIEFIGRIDNQVKVRGFRIELGEIETTLTQHPDINQALVTVTQNSGGEKQLVAYLVSSTVVTLTSKKVRIFLEDKLPEYMIPVGFFFLNQFPLTPNGKIDRKSLPKIDLSLKREVDFVAPNNTTQIKLVEIWQEVLGIESIGINDNFFSLGGNSLLATQVIVRVRNIFQIIELALSYLFELPTIAQLTPQIEQKQKSSISDSITIEVVDRDEKNKFPLSFAQERLWFINQLEGSNPVYNISTVSKIFGELNIEALKQAITHLINRHESLRTNFINQEGKPYVKIHSTIELPLTVINQSNNRPFVTQNVQFVKQKNKIKFNLENDRLIDFTLIQTSAKENILIIVIHHIISDGWSMGIITQELAQLYQQYHHQDSQSSFSPLPSLPIQYLDYGKWQKEYLSGEIFTHQLNYWQKQLADIPPLLDLPTDYPRPKEQTYQGESVAINLPVQLQLRLKQISKNQNATLYMTVLAVFSILLSRYSNQEDIVIGTPIANRNYSQCEGIVGFFANTQALRIDLTNNPNFADLLFQVKRVVLEASQHQDIPFEKLVEKLNPVRSLSHNPIFQVMLAWDNTPIKEEKWSSEITVTSQVLDSRLINTAKFDLSLAFRETEDTIIGIFNYNTDLFTRETIDRMSEHFQVLLSAIVDNPQQPISSLPLLAKTETQQILIDWNQTQSNYPQDKCIHQLFEAQVVQTPDNIALVLASQTITYRQLNHKANKIAHYLQNKGVEKETLVGIYTDGSSFEMIIAMLGILKAECAYVPIDSQYPRARINFILEDADINILLTTQSSLDTSIIEKPLTIINLDDNPEIIQCNQDNLDTSINGDNLAYLIYTSGSTGKPKGVLIPHRGVVRLVKDTNYVNITSEDVFSQTASVSFDAATFEIWGSLLNGSKLVLLPTSKPSIAEIARVIQTQKVTILWLTSGLFNLIVDEQIDSLSCVKQIYTGGEVMLLSQAKKAQKHLPQTQINNVYGPTENTTFTTFYPLPSQTSLPSIVPIGKPINQTQVYILNHHHQLNPIGVEGELYIGGDGLARGYLNRPELTAKKFINNPFGEGKLYKTGDRVKYLANGNIEFVGRIDNQVKVRGFRIELAEIETVLNQHLLIEEAVVIIQQNSPSNKYLTAYLKSGQQLKLAEVKDYLEQKLPNYMIPSAFIFVEEFPLTANGKIDKKALPLPQFTSNNQTYLAPENEIESQLVVIWQNVLKVEKIGINDNFFDLGGHSLLATQLVSRITQNWQIEVPLKIIFEKPSVKQIAVYLDQKLQNPTDFKPYNNQNKSVIIINDRGTKTPLYFINSTAVAYNLNKYLPDNQPFYSINIFSLTNRTKKPFEQLTISDFAEYLVKDLSDFQDSKNYSLIGFCQDGALTLEIAQQLQARGYNIDFLGLVDVLFYREKIKLTDRLKMIKTFKANYFSSRLKMYADNIFKKVNEFKQVINNPVIDQEISAFEKLELDKQLYKFYRQAVERYEPTIYQGKINSFLSQEFCLGDLSKLEAIAPNNLEVCKIDSLHKTFFQEPYIQLFSDKLIDYLDN